VEASADDEVGNVFSRTMRERVRLGGNRGHCVLSVGVFFGSLGGENAGVARITNNTIAPLCFLCGYAGSDIHVGSASKMQLKPRR
jgi:hypothetical protein